MPLLPFSSSAFTFSLVKGEVVSNGRGGPISHGTPEDFASRVLCPILHWKENPSEHDSAERRFSLKVENARKGDSFLGRLRRELPWLGPMTWNALSPNLVFHPFVGVGWTLATDGVRVLLLVSGTPSAGTYFLAHRENVVGPITSSIVEEWGWEENKPKPKAFGQRSRLSRTERLEKYLALI